MKNVVQTAAVGIALRTLSVEEVREVHSWFDHLRNWDGDEHVRTISAPLDAMPGVFVLHTSSDVRIFFRLQGDTMTILDIAKKRAIVMSGHIPGMS